MKIKIHALVLLFVLAIISCNSKKDIKATTESSENLQSVKTNPYTNLDQSPMDMIYYPENYPILRMNHGDTVPLVARVIYSRPHKKGRQIFGEGNAFLCPYGKIWRLGANEATEIQFFKNVSIAGTNIPAGDYVMYCIPHADRWTIVLNKNLYTWGLHVDETKDFFRTDVPVMEQTPPAEDFTMIFVDASGGAGLLMTWDNVKVVLPIMFLK
ncbi:MAG: DUF2911 domain-containing protein [Niastella sp.]|nr:DUF2911 domain-containing protein [Niastella sp.]